MFRLFLDFVLILISVIYLNFNNPPALILMGMVAALIVIVLIERMKDNDRRR